MRQPTCIVLHTNCPVPGGGHGSGIHPSTPAPNETLDPACIVHITKIIHKVVPFKELLVVIDDCYHKWCLTLRVIEDIKLVA